MMLNTVRSVIGDLLGREPDLSGTQVGEVLVRLRETDPSLSFRRACRPGKEGAEFVRIPRNGIAYFAKAQYRILNPGHASGVGLCFVKGGEDDPTGVFLCEGLAASREERDEAIKEYLFSFGIPREDLLVLPAYLFPGTYERTPENIAALRERGASLLHEAAN